MFGNFVLIPGDATDDGVIRISCTLTASKRGRHDVDSKV